MTDSRIYVPGASPDICERVAQRIAAAPSPLELLALSSRERGDALALRYVRAVDDHSTQDWTYREAWRAAAGLSACLRGQGIGPEDAVAILMPACPEGVIAFVAASDAGVALPLNGLLGAEALSAQLRLANVKALIVSAQDEASVSRLASALAGLPQLLCVVGLEPGATNRFNASASLDWAAAIATEPTAAPAGDRIGALFHTGGTTGSPKLAQLSLKSIAAGAHMAAGTTGFTSDDALLVGLPLFHVGGAICSSLSALSVGASVTFASPNGARNPQLIAAIWDLIDRLGITVTVFVPTTLGAIEKVPVGTADLSRLRCLMTGASMLPMGLGQRIEDKTGAAIANVFGMTELAGIGAGQPVDGVRREPGIGCAAPLIEAWIDEGELVFRGPNVFSGYRTEEGVLQQPVDGVVRSGDLAVLLPDGQLRIVGRRKDVIIRSGHNIDPAAIEELALRHPLVLEAAAVGMPDAYAGEVPVLCLVLKDESADIEEILAWISERVFEPPARPRRAFLMKALPLTDVGKVARYRLRQQVAAEAAREAIGSDAADISCSDPGGRVLRINWNKGADLARGQRILADLGLAIEPV